MTNPAPALILVKNGSPLTTSLLVAEKFNKRHDTVLRNIDALFGSQNDFARRNFAAIFYQERKAALFNRAALISQQKRLANG